MKRYWLISLALLLTGCNLSQIDRPRPPESFYWKKEGYTLQMNELAMEQCGLGLVYEARSTGDKNSFIQLHDKFEQCMIKQGFEHSAEGWKELDPEYIYNWR